MTENLENTNHEKSLQKSLFDIASESWRLKKAFERVLNLLDVKEKQKNLSKLNWFEKKLKESLHESGYKFSNFEGEPYSTGIPATAINIDDFDSDEGLYVKQTIEPTILDENGRILKTGSIIVDKAVNE